MGQGADLNGRYLRYSGTGNGGQCETWGWGKTAIEGRAGQLHKVRYCMFVQR